MKVTYKANIPVVSPLGSLDTRNAGEFRSTVDSLIAKRVSRIILDASSIEFISSEGLYVLMQTHYRMNESGGNLVVCSVKNEIISLLKAIGLYSELIFIRSIGDAVSSTVTKTESETRNHYSNDTVQEINREEDHPYELDENEIKFESPRVIECEECGAFVRVYASGRFMCPSCRTEFTVGTDGVVVF